MFAFKLFICIGVLIHKIVSQIVDVPLCAFRWCEDYSGCIQKPQI